ncbi:MAG: hypothetical protein PVH41_01200 [Anaerolineae bacterium]|jgi:hypothetical protein
MGEERVREALATHVDGRGSLGLESRGAQVGGELTEEEHTELASLARLADLLAERMQPLRPSPVFVQSLGAEIVEAAGRKMESRERRHRVAVIGAAVAGAAVSVASVVGGVVVLIRWLRTRTTARQVSTA